MTITVHRTTGGTVTLDAEAGWHVDEHGYLHIRGTAGNTATFAPTAWAFVARGKMQSR